MKIIHSYLDKSFVIGRTPKNFDAVFNISDGNCFIYAHDFLTELETIFDVEKNEMKIVVNLWAEKINKDISLKTYWDFKKILLVPLENGTIYYSDFD